MEYDGAGSFTQTDFAVANGLEVPGVPSATGFHPFEHGTYTVKPDCTGNATIFFPAPPGHTGAVIEVMFVLSNSGRTIHQIVSSLTPPAL